MKKVILIIAVLLCSGSAIAQIRVYPVTYMKVYDGKVKSAKKTQDEISVKWKDNDASTIDNISYVEYPDGYIIPITEIEEDSRDSNGNRVFKFTAVDEGKRDVVCYITKYNLRDIAISIAYSKNLIYSFFVNLFEYTQKSEPIYNNN